MYPKILNQICGYKDADQYVRKNIGNAITEMQEFYPHCKSADSLNGIIGGKNDIFDSRAESCESNIKYYEAWKQGHQEKYNCDKTCPFTRSSVTMNEVLKNTFLNEFIAVYLSRTFFKKKGIK